MELVFDRSDHATIQLQIPVGNLGQLKLSTTFRKSSWSLESESREEGELKMFLHFIEGEDYDLAVSMPQSFMNREMSFLELISPVLQFTDAMQVYVKESRNFIAFLATFSSPST